MGTAPPGLTARLLGTWTLVAMEGRRASGAVFHPWGTDVRGRLTYDAGGHVALQIAKAGNAPFASDDLEAGTPEEVQRAFDGYHAWFGRFEVDPDEGAVVHRIEASLFPNWEGRSRGAWSRSPGTSWSYARVPSTTGASPWSSSRGGFAPEAGDDRASRAAEGSRQRGYTRNPSPRPR